MRWLHAFGLSAVVVCGCGTDDSPRDMDADHDGGATSEPDAGGMTGQPAPLPPKSREFAGVLNLVDGDAADQLDFYLRDSTLIHPVKRHGLTKSLNLFLEHYREEYDFLYFFTDHPLPDAMAVAEFEHVNYQAEPGGTLEFDVHASEYRSDGRLIGVIGAQYRPGIYPPIAHETVHNWANYLDDRFGLGVGAGAQFGPHWGFAGVNGLLGGYDPETLRCADPAGEKPPACKPESNGSTRYTVKNFFPQDNSSLSSYAPLELYLMGLLPKSEVPPSIQVLKEASFVEGSFDASSDTIQVEAKARQEVAFADVLARHGERPLLTEEERHFRAAFVVISKEPASDALLGEVGRWAAIFGAREADPTLPSFAAYTGKRATLDTTLGARRSEGESIPRARALQTCDVLAQDCGRANIGCYLTGPGVCAISRNVTQGGTCDSIYSCAPGLDCVSSAAAPNDFVCMPYCDAIHPDDASHGCSKVCKVNYLTIQDDHGKTQGGICTP
jgi:hypothetical protein